MGVYPILPQRFLNCPLFGCLSNAIAGVRTFVGRMQPQNDRFFRNAHVKQFLTGINVGGVLLEPNVSIEEKFHWSTSQVLSGRTGAMMSPRMVPVLCIKPKAGRCSSVVVSSTGAAPGLMSLFKDCTSISITAMRSPTEAVLSVSSNSGSTVFSFLHPFISQF